MTPRQIIKDLKFVKHLFLGILIFALMHVSTSITSKEEVSPHLPVSRVELDHFLQEFDILANKLFSDSKSPGAAITIVKDGRIIYGKGFGVKKANTTDSIDIHTAFRIASVSKTFAGVLTGKMVDQGKLNWEDPVQKYVPQFSLKNPEYASKMHVRHILSQSTGLIQHAFTNYIETGQDLNTMIAALPEVELMAEPGKVFSYQNVVFGVIEPVLESATGRNYSTLIKEEIFEPLRMTDASMDYESMITNENIAYPNSQRRSGWAVDKISKTYYNVPSAGGINASVSDMANYMIALSGHRPEIISQKVIDEIFESQINTNIRWKYFSKWKDYKKSYYGLGWRIVENGESTVAFHGGYVNGYRSQLAINTNEDLGICVLTNSPASFSSDLVPEFLKLYDTYKERINMEEQSQIALKDIRRSPLY